MKSKSIFKLTLCVLFVFMLAFTAACTPNFKSNEDGGGEGKIKLNISVYNGGFGYEWLNQAVTAFNAQSEEFYINKPSANKNEHSNIFASVKAGSTLYDMFVVETDVIEFASFDLLADISDIWESDVDGNGKTIEQKMLASDEFKAAYTYNGKQYALPLADAMSGFVYDHDTFLEKRFLFGRDGDFIKTPDSDLSLGKDGVEGTYDDGHPQTESQWEQMIKKIKNSGYCPIIYSGKYKQYTDVLYDALYAQYDGINAYLSSYYFNGSYKFAGDAQATQITEENGYRVFEMEGRLKALEFMSAYLGKDVKESDGYTNAGAFKIGFSHTDAQNEFIIKNADDTSGKSAMLYEGEWWENESSLTFDSLKEDGNADYAYGKRNYKFMTLPYLEGAEFDSGNVLISNDQTNIIVKKQTDDDKLRGCKDFLKFLHKDEWLKKFTQITGASRPFDYSLTPDEQKDMTSFGKNVYEMYRDQNNKILRPRLYRRTVPIYRYSNPSVHMYRTDNYYIVMEGLNNLTPKQYYDLGISYHKNNWAAMLSSSK